MHIPAAAAAAAAGSDVICVNGEGGDVVFILKGVGMGATGWMGALPSVNMYVVSND